MPAPFFANQRRRQRGQALVFSLVTLAIIILTMVTMYSMGQQSINKMKLQNTADAAAYSAVLAEARDYNFSAYTNRAVVANQVAVAQVVSLTSWARNYGNTYDGPSSWIPNVLTSLGAGLARVTWDPPWRASKAISKGFRSAFNTIGPVTTKLLDGLIDVLATAQTIYHYGTALTVAQTIGLDPATVLNKFAGVDSTSLGVLKDLLTFNPAYNIIKLNDSNAAISTTGVATAIVHMAQWFTFTNKKDPNAATGDKDGLKGDRMAQVTYDSLDGFTKERSTKGGGPGKNFPEMMYLLPITIDPTRFIPYQSGALLMYLWHRGGTELKNINNSKKTWSAMDATGFFGIGIFWISILGIPIPIPIPFPFIPMGWGAAQAGPDAPLDTRNFATPAADAYGGVFGNVNTSGAAAIQRGRGAGATLDSRAGLRTYFDVKKVDKDNLTGPPLILEIEKGAGSIPISNAVSGGQFTLTNGTRSNYMRSLSKAEIYFSRPPKLWARGDSKTEVGSLYNPYWQAHLLPNSFVEQYVSMAFHLL